MNKWCSSLNLFVCSSLIVLRSMGKRGQSSTSYQDRVVRQRRVDYFWKTLHECCGSLPTEEDIATSLLEAAGIKSKRQLRAQTELDLEKLGDILDMSIYIYIYIDITYIYTYKYIYIYRHIHMYYQYIYLHIYIYIFLNFIRRSC